MNVFIDKMLKIYLEILPFKYCLETIHVALRLFKMAVMFCWLIYNMSSFFGLNNKTPLGMLEFTVTFYFFQNEEIFVQLDELDELDRITHA